MPDNIEVPKEGLYVSTIPGGERLVVVDVNEVEDDDDEEGDENDMSAPSWEFDAT